MFRKIWVLALGLALVSAVSIAQVNTKKGEWSNPNTYFDCTSTPGVTNLVTNCRFDNGFTGWIQGGDPTFQSVQPGCGHSGNFCAFMGSVNYNGTLTQPINTGAAATCSLSFWLSNSGQPSHFGVQWNAHQVMDIYYVPNIGYTQFSVSGLPAVGGNTWVTFEFYNPPSFIDFTDVVVTCP